MSEHDGLISQFTDVTGVDPDQARFYLESAAWNVEVSQMAREVMRFKHCNY